MTLILEDQSYIRIAETTVGAEGSYVFTRLRHSGEGYNVLFAQERNTQYEIDQVVSWVWIGPVVLGDGQVIDLPDLEIGLQGFDPVSPEPDAIISATALSSEHPLLFEWTAYPQAETYWVDLMRGEVQELVWQSDFVQALSVAFDGTLDDGVPIAPGEYWWGVGARQTLAPYTLTVYGYLSGFTVEQ